MYYVGNEKGRGRLGEALKAMSARLLIFLYFLEFCCCNESALYAVNERPSCVPKRSRADLFWLHKLCLCLFVFVCVFVCSFVCLLVFVCASRYVRVCMFKCAYLCMCAIGFYI